MMGLWSLHEAPSSQGSSLIESHRMIFHEYCFKVPARSLYHACQCCDIDLMMITGAMTSMSVFHRSVDILAGQPPLRDCLRIV